MFWLKLMRKRAATCNSLILLGKLLIIMGTHGKPQSVRNDNDAVFKTTLFRVTLKLIGVRQQFTDLGSPWQNGRIERFWRTLKSELQTKAVRSRHHSLAIQTRMKFASVQAMHSLLATFEFSYNAYRPHQSLGGAAKAENQDDCEDDGLYMHALKQGACAAYYFLQLGGGQSTDDGVGGYAQAAAFFPGILDTTGLGF
jgi:Integrase core domain